MDCREFKRLIWEELDGALAEDRLAEFCAHRRQCAECEREYLKQRRLKLYIRCFPTVGEVSDQFRSELLTRVRNGDLRSHYRLNYVRVTATLALFMAILVGMLFAVNSYREYMLESSSFIARYPEGYEAVRSASAPSLQHELALRPEPPVYALNMPELRTEDFVLKLLANYRNGEVSEQLVVKLAVEPGLLEGVSMKLPERSALAPFTGQPGQTVVLFPRPLPTTIYCSVERDDLIQLRRFALDLISTYGPRVTRRGPSAQLEAGLLPYDPTKVEPPGEPPAVIEVSGAGFDARTVPPGPVSLVMKFASRPQEN